MYIHITFIHLTRNTYTSHPTALPSTKHKLFVSLIENYYKFQAAILTDLATVTKEVQGLASGQLAKQHQKHYSNKNHDQIFTYT